MSSYFQEFVNLGVFVKSGLYLPRILMLSSTSLHSTFPVVKCSPPISILQHTATPLKNSGGKLKVPLPPIKPDQAPNDPSLRIIIFLFTLAFLQSSLLTHLVVSPPPVTATLFMFPLISRTSGSDDLIMCPKAAHCYAVMSFPV